MIDVTCHRCGNPLIEPGGLLFGAPAKEKIDCFIGQVDVTIKLHLCMTCLNAVLVEIKKTRDLYNAKKASRGHTIGPFGDI